jgi:hypothetical protein
MRKTVAFGNFLNRRVGNDQHLDRAFTKSSVNEIR